MSALAMPLLVPVTVLALFGLGGWRCPDLSKTRRRMEALRLQVGDRPLLICANHLTMIDSALLCWLLFDWRQLILKPELVPWHTPEGDRFGGNVLMRMFGYLTRCLYVERGGSRSANRATLGKAAALLRARGLVCIFPEGGRSRTGRVEADQVTYGVGRICRDVPDCVVLCVYLRGDRQQTFGFAPPHGDRLRVSMTLLEPNRDVPGLRGDREVALEINATLRDLEARHFKHQTVTSASTCADVYNT